MKKITPKEYARALYEVTKGQTGEALDRAVVGFVELLFKHNRIKKAGQIVNEFIAYAKKQAGIVDVEITSARQLDTHTIEVIKKTFGEHVETVEKIDPSILGGIKARTADTIFDASLQTQLVRLKQALL